MTRAAALAIALAGINLAVAPLGAAEKADASKFSQRGATEKTPSYSQYFSWINNTNEGSTDHNTMVNLDFFEWLHTEYGMTLDIYVISAGAIDGPRRYGTMTEDRFKANFPKGWGHIYEKAKAMDTRLGTWLGPDGFGDTREEEIARRDMIVSLCRDYNFALLKMDAVCSQLREPKQEALKKTLIECRKHCPDMILLNHRLKLGAAEPYATTFLWGGAETYIDVHMANWASPAPHNRATALMRPLPPDLMRLTEDHGVCISSCLDFWDDDLVLQAFNRCLILAPQTYGNPWFLRDEEYPRFARINNLHRRFRDIMVDGMVLPEEQYGPYAVSRGDESTRLVTLRNLSWEPKKYTVKLDKSVGLAGSGRVELRQLHPTERIIGRYPAGGEVTVEVLPFRACLLLATSTPSGELGVTGCDYHVVRDLPGKPAVIKLLGLPGTTASVKLAPINRSTYTGVTLNGKAAPALLEGQAMDVTFPGKPLKKKWHRKLGDLKPVAIPADAEALYEASCFAADSNALEYRAIERSGPTKIKQIQAARDVFFAQQLLRERGCWDRFMFDGDDKTYFGGSSRVRPVRGGALRLDFGEQLRADTLTITGTYDDSGLWSEIAPKYLTDAKGRPGGLTGEYFTGSTFEGKPVVTRTDRQISFRWRNDPAQGVPVRDFCVRWTGKITPVTSGTYRFVCKAPSAQLWVGGKQIIGGGAGGVVDLKANQAYDIKLEHVGRTGGTWVQLGWGLATRPAPQVSADLARWTTLPFTTTDSGMTVKLSGQGGVRYFRMAGTFTTVKEVVAGRPKGKPISRKAWRGSNLMASYASAPAEKAWQCSFTLDQAARGAYLCIGVAGRHGAELAYAALRVDGEPVGCATRAPSYLVNPWEYPVRTPTQNVTYYVPVTPEMIGKPIDAVLLGLDGVGENVTPDVWITSYPIPHESMELILHTATTKQAALPAPAVTTVRR
ncbi:MAG: hypothetical protein AMK72_02215 [Planctomycetes bacterium SM23_25]|nr:MAG: hypothetical protein AMK72_02215 [Planctomycetes bacterium SM23_25]